MTMTTTSIARHLRARPHPVGAPAPAGVGGAALIVGGASFPDLVRRASPLRRPLAREDALDRPVGARRARVRRVARRVGDSLGRAERRRRRDRPRSLHAAPLARGGRGEGRQRARHLRLPVAAGRLRGRRARSRRRRRRGRTCDRSVRRHREASTYNPKTKRYFGISDAYVPSPIALAARRLESIGESPATWDHVRTAAPKLQASSGTRSGSASRGSSTRTSRSRAF